MTDAHAFETTLRWPADPAQVLPPDPAFSRNNILGGAGKPDARLRTHGVWRRGLALQPGGTDGHGAFAMPHADLPGHRV